MNPQVSFIVAGISQSPKDRTRRKRIVLETAIVADAVTDPAADKAVRLKLVNQIYQLLTLLAT